MNTKLRALVACTWSLIFLFILCAGYIVISYAGFRAALQKHEELYGDVDAEAALEIDGCGAERDELNAARNRFLDAEANFSLPAMGLLFLTACSVLLYAIKAKRLEREEQAKNAQHNTE